MVARRATDPAAAPLAPRRARKPASPWALPSRREQQREAKRNAVLTTAARMFNERGFHATSLDDIAASLHVTKPTLYYYVKNKDEILLACVNKGLRMTLDGIEASRQAGGNALDQLRACMQVYAEIVTQPFGMCLIRVGDEEVPEPSRTELRRMKSEIDLAFRRLVAQGVEEGSIAPCDPKIAAFVIAGGLSWIGRWYRPDGQYAAPEVIAQCIQALLRGVLQRPDAASPPAPTRAARRRGRTPS
ncbi:MAG: TetR/AcrR family transcriptional regulator [Comamonadaceae bacterium]|nr:TetR/AcrR family transcriptional regulator [Burkholderiales bacterium]MEB2347800.1 TetR/AcrR family transcriptional regulator [Comamonadaceae bacterium]